MRMTRSLATIAIVGALLTAPAWAQTMTNDSHQPASHAVHHVRSAKPERMSADRHRHHLVTGDDSAEMLNRKALEDHHNGS
jgi:hypothetical protein